MKRSPSIHITETALQSILNDWFEGSNVSINTKKLTDHIMKQGAGYKLSFRTVVESTNQKDRVKMDRIKTSASSDAHQFIKYLNLHRRNLKHRNPTVIRETDTDWQFVKEAAGFVKQFQEAFELTEVEAYSNYTYIFLNILVGPFSIRKVKSLNDKIFFRQECMQKAEQSTNQDLAEELMEIYKTRIYEKTGITNSNFTPEDAINFYNAADIAIELGLKAKQYISAQFDSLEWATEVPSITQIGNDKARERAIKWMAENNLRKKRVINIPKGLDQNKLEALKNFAQDETDN